MADEVDTLLDAFTAGFLLEHQDFKSASRYPLAGYTDDEMKGRLREEFEAWIGEDRTDLISEPTEGEQILDLDITYHVFKTAMDELVDMAHSGNLARRHHLEDAVACFEDIGVLMRAQGIIKTVLDIREEVEREEDADETARDAGVNRGSDDGAGTEEEAEA